MCVTSMYHRWNEETWRDEKEGHSQLNIISVSEVHGEIFTASVSKHWLLLVALKRCPEWSQIHNSELKYGQVLQYCHFLNYCTNEDRPFISKLSLLFPVVTVRTSILIVVLVIWFIVMHNFSTIKSWKILKHRVRLWCAWDECLSVLPLPFYVVELESSKNLVWCWVGKVN